MNYEHENADLIMECEETEDCEFLICNDPECGCLNHPHKKEELWPDHPNHPDKQKARGRLKIMDTDTYDRDFEGPEDSTTDEAPELTQEPTRPTAEQEAIWLRRDVLRDVMHLDGNRGTPLAVLCEHTSKLITFIETGEVPE